MNMMTQGSIAGTRNGNAEYAKDPRAHSGKVRLGTSQEIHDGRPSGAASCGDSRLGCKGDLSR